MAFRKSPIDESRRPMLPVDQDVEHAHDLPDHDSDATEVDSIHSLQRPEYPFEQCLPEKAYDTYSSTTSLSSSRKRHHYMKGQGWVFWMWLRWGVVVGLQTIIVLLLWLRPEVVHDRETQAVLKGKSVETGDDINGLYRTLSHTYTYLKPDPDRFIPNMTSNDNRMEIRKNWDLLMPLGSGSVAIREYRDYPLLGDPITDDPIRSGPLFEASWTHALHCLYYAVDSYHQLIVNGPSDEDNPYHAGHCFEYLRNSILCNLDMTLEGSMSTLDDKDRGQPHVCRNREEAIAWIEQRRVDDLQDIVGP